MNSLQTQLVFPKHWPDPQTHTLCTRESPGQSARVETYFLEVYTIFKDLPYQSNGRVVGKGVQAVLGSALIYIFYEESLIV